MKKDKIIVILIGLVIFCLSIGYSSFGSILSINDLGMSIRLTKDIRITGISAMTGINDGVSNYEEYNIDDISVGIRLPNADSVVSYKINITNFEETEMGIFDIKGLPENLEYTFPDNNYSLQQKICVVNDCNLGISKDIYINIGYKEGMYNSDDIEYNIKLDLDFRKFHKIVYDNINNNRYPTEIIDGGYLTVDFGDNYPTTIEIYMNNQEINDYSYQNGTLSIKNITGDLVIKSTAIPSAEAPVLDNGMIPVKIANNGTVYTVSSTDSTWYNYDNKEWANVILVNDTSRSTYQNTTGVEVDQDDILAYYVWIPRYKYRIYSQKCSDVSNPTIENYPTCYHYDVSDEDKANINLMMYQIITGEGIDYTIEEATIVADNALNSGFAIIPYFGVAVSTLELIDEYNTMTGSTLEYTTEFAPSNHIPGTSPTEIDINFELTTTKMSTGDAINSYRTHPAFWWDDNSDGVVDSGETIAGIWVGKFETSANVDSTCYTSESAENCVSSNVSPRILPNVSSLRYQNISAQFTTSRKFSENKNIYGLSNISTNSHMMKNIEWGAVAYLSHSKYGINYEIRTNNNSSYITGCGALAENGNHTSECEISYNSSSTPQSTTGNITGIFDMSGGGMENVMGVLSDGSGNPIIGYDENINSGFNGFLSIQQMYESGINFPESKYYDLYISENTVSGCRGGICYGHATYETENWYEDTASFAEWDHPWLDRGGIFLALETTGAFARAFSSGTAEVFDSWRSVLVVGFGE